MENVNKQLLDALKGMVSYVFGDLESGKSDVCDELRQLIAAAEQAQQADDTDAEWRRLALQFDGHRMQALAHLRCLLENPESHAEAVRAFLTAPPLSGEQALTERIAAMCQSTDDWQPSGIDYDRSMHSNPDAAAWAKFFVETFPALKGKEGLMLGWFANAMMAMHDYLQAQPPAVAVTVPDGSVPVPLGFLQAFHAMSHNYSLQAQAPDHYAGTERDAFSDAYARCGRELAKLRAMFAAEGCGACGDGCKGQGCRLERESPLTCQTCNGQVMVGGLLPNGGGYDGQPCPDCATPQATAEDSSVVQADALKLLQYMVDRMRDDGRGFLVVNGMDGKEVVSEWLPAARAVLATAQKGE